jgi:hypothetical protein
VTEIRIRVPRVPAGAGSNLLGLAGLIAVAVCVGGLAGNWWLSGLVAGVFAVGLAHLAQAQPRRQQAAAAAGAVPKLSPVKAA